MFFSCVQYAIDNIALDKYKDIKLDDNEEKEN